MYLEISARHTGKTSRLIKSFWEGDWKSSLIVAPTGGMARYLINNSAITAGHICTKFELEDHNRYVRKTHHMKHLDNIRLLWDEFDMGDEFTKYIKIGDYYTTTPCKTRTPEDIVAHARGKEDTLLTLVQTYRSLYGKDHDVYAWASHPSLEHKACNSTERNGMLFEAKYKESQRG